MDQLKEDWLNIKEVILYGLGNIGRKCFKKLSETFTIQTIIDNDEKKQGYYQAVPVMGFQEAVPLMRTYKTIVMTGGKVYEKIARELVENGFIENRDFCAIEHFVSEWYWKKEHKNLLLEIHTAVTTRCTFHCKNCNMFMPYYETAGDFELDELKENFDLLFQYVDYVFCINLLGGEPLLYTHLGDLILYLYQTYGNRIGTIGIITNGSLLPDDKLINIMKTCDVYVQVSDYSEKIPYSGRILALIDLLKKKEISYIRRRSMQWKDFGFPEQEAKFCTESLRQHMLTCAPVFHGLNDGKYYFCHVAWSAEKCGRFHLSESDYIDLKSLKKESDTDKRKLVAHSLGELQSPGYITLCKICGGCGEDNKLTVPAAVQVERSNE